MVGLWHAGGGPHLGGGSLCQRHSIHGQPSPNSRSGIDAPLASGRHELFYLSKDSSIVAIAIDPQRTPSDSAGRVLFRAAGPTRTGIAGDVYDVTPDGERFLLKREVGLSPIHVVLNWDAHLDR